MINQTIIGIDPSAKKIAIVLMGPGGLAADSFQLTKKKTTPTSPESVGKALAVMRDYLHDKSHMMTSERYAFIEAPLVGRGGVNTTLKQAYVGGVIQACLIEVGFKVHVVHPSTWRSGLGIKARETTALKAATRQYVMTQSPKLFRMVDGDNDLTDAGAIALYGADQRRKADFIAHTGLAESEVQGKRRSDVVRPSRMRARVRPIGMPRSERGDG